MGHGKYNNDGGHYGNNKFNFEDLEVWQKAVDFSKRVINVAERIGKEKKHFRLLEQLEAAAASVPLNIAEGKGRYHKKEFIQFLYISRGSLYETITLLHIFQKLEWIETEQLESLKQCSMEISRMISSLIRAIKDSA